MPSGGAASPAPWTTCPTATRAPLVLRYFAEQSYAEIAVALELSEAQVGMLLYRARRKLRDVLSEKECE